MKLLLAQFVRDYLACQRHGGQRVGIGAGGIADARLVCSSAAPILSPTQFSGFKLHMRYFNVTSRRSWRDDELAKKGRTVPDRGKCDISNPRVCRRQVVMRFLRCSHSKRWQDSQKTMGIFDWIKRIQNVIATSKLRECCMAIRAASHTAAKPLSSRNHCNAGL